MKRRNKNLALAGMLAAPLLFLSGCVQSHVVNGVRVPTEAGLHGFIYRFIVTPMSNFVDLFAHNMNLGYGLAIILVTLIIRLLILPLGLNQAYKSTYMQEKMRYLAPVFEPLNARMKAATTSEEKMAAQQAIMQAQRDNGVNMLSSIGCLPMLIQWPFFIALYNAAAYTPGISNAHFLGFSLGHPNFWITILSGVLYLIQALLSMVGMSDEQKRQSRMMILISPLMIVFFSWVSPAGVALYWAVGGVVMVLQQVIISFIMKPRMRNKIDEEFKNNPPKINDLPKDVTPAEAEVEAVQALSEPEKTPKTGGRNAGKQNRK